MTKVTPDRPSSEPPGADMKNWDIPALDVAPHAPSILTSTSDARAIVINLPAGERLQEHEVHERAFVVVGAGDVEVSTTDGTAIAGGPGLLFEFDPGERHEVLARSDTRLLLLLTPWPGDGHPGTMTLDEKADVRERAAEHQG
jgi:quercetin dioxygenase-like cupin family protein